MSTALLRQAFMQFPAQEQASLLDDLILSSCDAMWEAGLAEEMEDRVDAVERGEMKLHASEANLNVRRTPKQLWLGQKEEHES
jgi:tRNA A37 N6-isopentenylltransferase MiaA